MRHQAVGENDAAAGDERISDRQLTRDARGPASTRTRSMLSFHGSSTCDVIILG
jgi:hypothetical protein